MIRSDKANHGRTQNLELAELSFFTSSGVQPQTTEVSEMTALIIALLEHREQHAQVRVCLEQAGHEVVVVDSFARAKAILQPPPLENQDRAEKKRVLREHSFDLIVSDVHLENGGTVFDFLKWIKSDPSLHEIPFVLFSLDPSQLAKYLADGVRTTARMFGAAKYILMSPFDSDIFAREIGEVLPPGTTEPIAIAKEGE